MQPFALDKRNALLKKDKSNEGSWDEKIVPLCQKINSLPGFFTTSSCAGRITLNKNSLKKVRDAFLYKTHKKADPKDIFECVEKNRDENTIYLRQEPCALHVSCKTLDDAISLVNKARSVGWKRSGVISINRKKCTCELVSTEWIVSLLQKNKKLLVNSKYLEEITKEANKRLEKTWDKIERLMSLV